MHGEEGGGELDVLQAPEHHGGHEARDVQHGAPAPRHHHGPRGWMREMDETLDGWGFIWFPRLAFNQEGCAIAD